jgi:hypothetical protein
MTEDQIESSPGYDPDEGRPNERHRGELTDDDGNEMRRAS